MVKRRVITFILLAFLPYLLIAQGVVTEIIEQPGIYNDWFTEPIEILYLVMWDGAVFRITSHLANAIYCDFNAFFKKTGYKHSDVMVCIHNHFHYPYPSEVDIKTFLSFREKGFTGWYLIYMQSTGQVLWVKERNKNERK